MPSGVVIASATFAGGDKNHDVNQTVTATLHPGDHDIKIVNNGADWFTLTSIAVPNIGPPVRVIGLEEVNWLFARMTMADGITGSVPLKISGVALQDGSYAATIIDLDTGKETHQTVEVNGFSISPISLASRDCVLVLKR